MASGHDHFQAAYDQFRTSSTYSEQSIVDPGSGGTFNLRGKDNAYAIIASGTRILPSNTPLGVRFTVFASTSAVTLTNAAGQPIAVVPAGQAIEVRPISTTSWAVPQPTLPAVQFTTVTEAASITAAAGTLTGANLCVYVTTGTVAGTALTPRSAALMFTDTPGAYIGFTWVIRMVSDGGNTTTLTAGTGHTITGTAAAATNTWQEYKVTFTSASACTFQNIGSGTVTATT